MAIEEHMVSLRLQIVAEIGHHLQLKMLFLTIFEPHLSTAKSVLNSCLIANSVFNCRLSGVVFVPTSQHGLNFWLVA